MSSCCAPQGGAAAVAPATRVAARPAAGRAGTLLDIPAGTFLMGTEAAEGFAEDGEGPVRSVQVDAFRIGRTAVTNAQFREFVRATAYITEAEQAGSAFVFYLQVDARLRPAIRQLSRELPWWVPVEGACWQRPSGRGSSIHDRLDHPVVQVSWNDAVAFCAWAGTRLPTEAEWEYAARGGLAGQRYPWGDEFEPDGQRRCNTWQGVFPAQPQPGWTPCTEPADAYPPNAWGLHNVAGNAWEWCADWFTPEYHRVTAGRDPFHDQPTGRKSMRGGSFLCHDTYCNRYRVAARGANSPGSASSNCGFRVAAPPGG